MIINKKLFILCIIIPIALIGLFYLLYLKPQISQEQVNSELARLNYEGKINDPLPEYNLCNISMTVDHTLIKTKSTCLNLEYNAPWKILMLMFRGKFITSEYSYQSPYKEGTSFNQILENLTESFISAHDYRYLWIPKINSNSPISFDVSATLNPDENEIKKLVLDENINTRIKTDYDFSYQYVDESADVYKLEWNLYRIGIDPIGNFNLDIEVDGKILNVTSGVGEIDKLSDNKVTISGVVTNTINLLQLYWDEYE